MKLKFLLPAAAAIMLTSGTAIAADQQTRSSNSAQADRHGASAGAEWRQRADRDDRRENRRERRANRRQPMEQGSASTYGSGAVHTERRRASAAVTSGGRASGPGTNSTGTTVEAYGETTRDGSYADIYGDSTAESRERRRDRDDDPDRN